MEYVHSFYDKGCILLSKMCKTNKAGIADFAAGVQFVATVCE